MTQVVRMSESDLQATVIDMAHAHGWMVWHSQQTKVNPIGRGGQRRLDPGFPDLVLVHPQQQRCIFIELKASGGRVSDAQWEWYTALALAGMKVFIFRPVDLDNGTIEQVLR